jgi:hypothetical protein
MGLGDCSTDRTASNRPARLHEDHTSAVAVGVGLARRSTPQASQTLSNATVYYIRTSNGTPHNADSVNILLPPLSSS